MSASGYILHRTDQVPWSKPHVLSMVTSRPIRLIVSCASAGAPGALYSTRYNSSGNPYMSYTIEGWAADIIRVPRVYQCAEMLRIAFGLGIRPAVFSQFLVYLLSS